MICATRFQHTHDVGMDHKKEEAEERRRRTRRRRKFYCDALAFIPSTSSILNCVKIYFRAYVGRPHEECDDIFFLRLQPCRRLFSLYHGLGSLIIHAVCKVYDGARKIS